MNFILILFIYQLFFSMVIKGMEQRVTPSITQSNTYLYAYVKDGFVTDLEIYLDQTTLLAKIPLTSKHIAHKKKNNYLIKVVLSANDISLIDQQWALHKNQIKKEDVLSQEESVHINDCFIASFKIVYSFAAFHSIKHSESLRLNKNHVKFSQDNPPKITISISCEEFKDLFESIKFNQTIMHGAFKVLSEVPQISFKSEPLD